MVSFARLFLRPRAAISRLFVKRDGNVAILGAVFLPVAIALLALGVDTGSIYYEQRHLQNITDLAAISGASNVSKADALAQLTVEHNGVKSFVFNDDEVIGAGGGDIGNDISRTKMWLETGRYSPDPDTSPDKRFVPGKSNPNAVRVEMEQTAQLFFGEALRKPPRIGATGVAYMASEAAFSVGSRLLKLDGGILNELLGQLLGADLSLTVMDYQALLDADISLFSFLDGLATQVGVTAGTYEEVLDANASVADVLAAASQIASPPSTASLLAGIANSPDVADLSIDLTGIIDLGVVGEVAIGEGDAAMDASIGIMDLIVATAGVANGSSQVELDLSASPPGLASARLSLAIGEPMQDSAWLAIGEEGSTIRTAQTRLFVEAVVGGSGVLKHLAVRLPIYVEVATAEARLANIFCPGGRSDRANVEVMAQPGVVNARIADLSGQLREIGAVQYFEPATLLSLPAIKVMGSAYAEMGNQRFSALRFSAADIRSGRIKSVNTSNFTSSLTATLIGDLVLDVNVAGISLLSTSAIQSALVDTLQLATVPLDKLIYNTATVLGVSIGEADIRVNGVRCDRPVLVQ